MHLEHKDIIAAPRDQVYKIVRDDLAKVVSFLPNIKKVTALEYTKMGENRTHIVNHWFAHANMPSLVEKFVKEELFSWKDTAVWKNDEFIVEYSIESVLAKEIYEAKGVNFFKETSDGQTELTITCDVQIHADKIPGIPKLVSRQIVPAIEKVLEKMLEPNLTSLGKGLKAYLSGKKAASQ